MFFRCFQRDQKGRLGRKGLRSFFIISPHFSSKCSVSIPLKISEDQKFSDVIKGVKEEAFITFFEAELYSEPCQTSKMECFAKIVHGSPALESSMKKNSNSRNEQKILLKLSLPSKKSF